MPRKTKEAVKPVGFLGKFPHKLEKVAFKAEEKYFDLRGKEITDSIKLKKLHNVWEEVDLENFDPRFN